MAKSPYFYGGGTAPAGKKPAAKPTPAKAPTFNAFFAANKKPAAKPKPPAAKPSTGTSAAQQVVDAALAPLLSSITSQEKTLGSNQASQQAALKAFSAQIIDYLKGAPGAIQGDFQGAVDTTNNLAQASADELLKANPNSLNQADLAAINAPQAQRDALAASNQNVFGGGAATLYHTAGTIPATAFAADKAAAGAFANSLPSIEGLQAQQLFSALLGNQSKDTAALAAQRAEVMSKAPGLLLDVQTQLAKQQAAGTTVDKTKTLTRTEYGDISYIWKNAKGTPAQKTAAVRAYLASIGKPQAWDGTPPTSAGKPATTKGKKIEVRSLANGQLQKFVNGNPVGKAYGPVKPINETGIGVRTLANGQIQTYDKASGVPIGAPWGPKKAPAAGSKPKTFTKGQLQDLQSKSYDTALTDALGYYYDDKGNKVASPQKTPLQTLRFLIGKGIPFKVAIHAMQNVARSELDELKTSNYELWQKWQAIMDWSK